MNQFLFFDIDGTLVTSDNRIPASAWNAIEEAKAKGNYVFLCSGRTRTSAERFDCPEMNGTIFCTGAGISTEEHGKILAVLDPVSVKNITEKTIALGGGVVVFTEDHGYASERAVANMMRFAKDCGSFGAEEMLKVYDMVPLAQYSNEPVLKFDIYLPDEEAHAVFVKDVVEKGTCWKRMTPAGMPGDIYGEINPEGISKGSAVLKILELYGGKTEDSYGFGDSMNDAEMMTACGHGIAMGNAAHALKELAEYVTDRVDEDGLANAMKHYSLY